MKKHAILSILAFSILFVLPNIVYGKVITRPIGGKITTGPASLSAAITCAAAYGPFIMTPVNVATPGPYFIRATTNGFPSTGKYLLGLYKIVPDLGTCYNPETGFPVPAFNIQLYGVSK